MKLTRFLIGLALLAAGLVGMGGAPASAAVRTLTTSYSCIAHTAVGDIGPSTGSGTVTVNLPGQVTLGKKLAARQITFALTIPEEMVDQMRSLSVDSVSATSDDAHYRLKRGTDPAIKKPITGLAIPETDVPATGDMTLVGTGTASGHTFKKVGDWKVLVPKVFSADAMAYGSIAGDQPVTIDCTLAAGAPTKIAVIKVVR